MNNMTEQIFPTEAEISNDIRLQALVLKGHKMKRDTWVRNVLKVYPDKTKDETEALYDKIFKRGLGSDSQLPSNSEELS